MVSLNQRENSFWKFDEREVDNTRIYLERLYHDLKKKFRDFSELQNIILDKANYTAESLTTAQKPEELAKETLIEPILRYLGFTWKGETKLRSPFGTRWPDYTIESTEQEGILLYLEAEAINTHLYSETKGRGQVFQWLLSKAAKTEYGIATDGLTWILVRFDESTNQLRDVQKIDLRPFFSTLVNPGSIKAEKESIEEIHKLLTLKSKNVKILINDYLSDSEQNKEEITKKFYDEYVRYVFGLDSSGKPTGRTSLLSSIIPPNNAKTPQNELFAVVTMNRLFFITFLDDKGIIPRNLLGILYEKYSNAHIGKSFYSTYLKPLFYDVFNKAGENRDSYIKYDELYRDIPYLNGGLFRKNIEYEDGYDIMNEGMEPLLLNLLAYNFLQNYGSKDYRIGLSEEADLKPEILGYIFEKTINYISGTGTNQQKMQGAYYTPEDVVDFIVKETLNRKILDKMKQGLLSAGWKERDLKGFDSIEDVIGNMPVNKKHCVAMLQAIDTIKVIDPACGSGHFVTTAANVITRVVASIRLAIEEPLDLYQIKRKVVTYNIYGIDMDKIGAEIAKLRLWLSIIAEVKDPLHIETLPNIDFNIMSGNTLIGLLNENLTLSLSSTGTNFIEPDEMEYLGNFLGDHKNEIFTLLNSVKTEDLSIAYQKILTDYRPESGASAARVHDLLGSIREQLYGAINEAYYSYIVSRETSGKISASVWQALAERSPFHWKFDFFSVFRDGGFDVIIGNPPYIEDKDYPKSEISIIKSLTLDPRRNKVPLMYESMNCGNTHAYFIERSLEMLDDEGYLGFIVPISLVSTNRMNSIRSLMHGKAANVSYYNFDDRPGKIFSGIEDCRSTIVIIEKGRGTSSVTTSKYHRWYSADRPTLFDELRVSKFSLAKLEELIPKLGTGLERELIEGLYHRCKQRTISDFYLEKGEKVWYHNAPRYWIHSHTDGNVPAVEYYDDFTIDPATNQIRLGKMKNKSVTSQYKFIQLDPKHTGLVTALLNSSIFYWWYVIYSDGRHLLEQQISSFPIDIEDCDRNTLDKLNSLVEILMREYDTNSNEKVNVRKGDYAIKIKEIIPKRSYETIKKIDEVLFDFLSLNEEEREFIANFDLNFRLGDYKPGK